jgi:lysozyme family protein
MCSVDRYLNGNGLFLRQNKGVHCPYLMTFSHKYICNCPTHVDLHLSIIYSSE